MQIKRKQQSNLLRLELAYVGKGVISVLHLEVPDNSTVEEVINSSGILSSHPEINININRVGIWGKKCSLNSKIQAGDRIEIYTPVIIDAMQARRLRAKNKSKNI